MTRWRSLALLGGALLLWACAEGPAPASPDDAADGGGRDGAPSPPLDRGPGDADAPDDAPDGLPDAPGPDAVPLRPPSDAGPSDGPPAPDGPPDAESPGPIDDCAAACARLARCDRLGDFGDEVTCRARCARVVEPPTHWFECLEAEADCRLVHLCRPPEPPPLSCPAVCAAAAGCGIDLPFADCPAVCAAHAGPNPDQPRFARCGEALDPTCDPEGFLACLGERVHPECGVHCAGAAACGAGGPDCLPACFAALHAPDPLVRRANTARVGCLALAGDDCLAADRCLDLDAPVERDLFCAVWERCEAGIGVSCADAWQRGQGHADYPACVVDALLRGCPAEPFQIFLRCLDAPPDAEEDVARVCGALCEAQGLCGAVPEGQSPLDCARACTTALSEGGVEARFPVERRLPCAASPDCPALVECLTDADPATGCAAHCAALDGCGLAEDGCLDRCVGLFARARQAAARDCVTAAGDCAAMGACVPGEPVGCDTICEREAACDRVDPDCALRCDDAHFADPQRAARRLACVAAAPLCGPAGVSGCAGAPSPVGDACLGWCRAQSDCLASEAAVAECIIACGEGFTGDAALRFERARPCLEALDPFTPCPALAACLDHDPAADCGPWCEALAGCEGPFEGCDALCDGEPLARWRAVSEGPCLAEVDDCAGVELCRAAPEAVFPRADREALCARNAACGVDELIPCARYFDTFGADIDMLRCLLRGLDPCPPNVEALLGACFDARRPGPNALAPCALWCRAHSRCAGLEVSVRACVAACVADAQADPEGPGVARLACSTAPSCDALAACEQAVE